MSKLQRVVRKKAGEDKATVSVNKNIFYPKDFITNNKKGDGMRNKKGFVDLFLGYAVFVGEAIFWGGVALMVGASAYLQPSHIVNRAVEKCEREAGVNCEATVQAMTKEDRKAYIRDTEASPAPYNSVGEIGTPTGLKI